MLRSDYGNDLEYIRIYKMGFSNQKDQKELEKTSGKKSRDSEKVSFSKVLDDEMLVLERRFV